MSTNYVIGEKIFSYCELFINPAQLILGGKSFFGIKKTSNHSIFNRNMPLTQI